MKEASRVDSEESEQESSKFCRNLFPFFSSDGVPSQTYSGEGKERKRRKLDHSNLCLLSLPFSHHLSSTFSPLALITLCLTKLLLRLFSELVQSTVGRGYRPLSFSSDSARISLDARASFLFLSPLPLLVLLLLFLLLSRLSPFARLNGLQPDGTLDLAMEAFSTVCPSWSHLHSRLPHLRLGHYRTRDARLLVWM